MIKALERDVGVVIVTHGDAVMVMLSVLCHYADVAKIEYCGNILFFRDVKVPDKSAANWKDDLYKSDHIDDVLRNKWTTKINSNVAWTEKPNFENPDVDQMALEVHEERKRETIAMVNQRKDKRGTMRMWTMSDSEKDRIEKVDSSTSPKSRAQTDHSDWDLHTSGRARTKTRDFVEGNSKLEAQLKAARAQRGEDVVDRAVFITCV